MGMKYFGAKVKRKEDPRLLRGRGLFVDDIKLPGIVHLAILRSPHAHARIRSVDVSHSLQAEGVKTVVTLWWIRHGLFCRTRPGYTTI